MELVVVIGHSPEELVEQVDGLGHGKLVVFALDELLPGLPLARADGGPEAGVELDVVLLQIGVQLLRTCMTHYKHKHKKYTSVSNLLQVKQHCVAAVVACALSARAVVGCAYQELLRS